MAVDLRGTHFFAATPLDEQFVDREHRSCNDEGVGDVKETVDESSVSRLPCTALTPPVSNVPGPLAPMPPCLVVYLVFWMEESRVHYQDP